MDINNYSRTAESFGVDNVRPIADIIELEDRGYIRLTLEQWGSDRNALYYVVSGYWQGVDVDATITADNSRGWETLRHSYEIAAKIYNSLVDSDEAIPLF